MAYLGITFELGQIQLAEYDDNGVLRAQPDGFGLAPAVASQQVHHPLGFAARPGAPNLGPDGKPLEGSGSLALIARDGTDRFIIPIGDPRDFANIPPLPAEGGSVQYAPRCPAPSFHVISAKDGTHQIYVEIGDSAHIIAVGRDANDEPIVEITHADGMGLTLFKRSAVLKNAAGDCYAQLSDDGGILNGNWKVTGAFDIGAASFPLVKFPALSTELGAIQNALTLIGAALAGLAAVPVNSPATTQCGAAVTGITAALAALATFNTSGPTLFTKGS